MTTVESLDAKRVDMQTLSNDKDDYLASYRAAARQLTAQIDDLAAEVAAERTVAGLSDAEQQAVAAKLAKLGG